MSAATAGKDAAKGGGAGGKRWLMHLFWVLGIGLGGYLVYRGLRDYDLDTLAAAIHAIPTANLLLGGLFTLASYGCLTIVDWLALRYVGRPLPYWKAGVAAFVSLSIGHSVGLAGLSSGAIRYRFYERWGLSVAEVAKLVLFCGMTVTLGLMVLGGIALIFSPEAAARFSGLSQGWLAALGGLCLALVGVYLALALRAVKVLETRWFTLDMPSWRLAVAQVVIGSVNFACVAAALHSLVAAVADASYFEVASAYVTGNVLTLVTHVPGGLGVIEAAVTHLVPSQNGLIGPLIAFRATYYLVPLGIGVLAFLVCELAIRRSNRAAARPAASRPAEQPGEERHDRPEQADGPARIDEAGAENRPRRAVAVD
jgi:glycosyltransferase 2 family protein